MGLVESDKKDIQLLYSEKPEKDDVENKDKESTSTKWRWRVKDEHSPPQIYNKCLFLSVFVFGILGAARGLDEGGISGSVAQVSFKKQFGLSDPNKSASEIADVKSNITSMVQLGSIGGCIISMFTVDKFGRIRALQMACVLMIIGVIIQITSFKVGQLYAGRLIEGLGVGQTTTIGPTYMSEVAPKLIRGLCGCIFAGAVYLGIMLSYFAHYGTSVHMAAVRNQWVVPTSLKLIFDGSILILSFVLCVESPRWFVKVNRQEEAAIALSKIRNLPIDHPYIVTEISDINDQVLAEKEATTGVSVIDMFKTIITLKANIYRFFVVACLTQLLGQWSGANSITIYAPELLAIAGVKGNEKLKMTAILGVVKFVSAYLSAFFIIDSLGRKRALFIGITVQMTCLLYFAIFLTILPQAEQDDVILTSSQKSASEAAIAAIYLSGTGWTMGFNSVQYLLGSEVFPLKIRSFAQSLVMVLHFANQYGNSKAVPKMMLAMKPYGTFYFFVAVNIISLLWAWFFVPEVAGRSLESMEEIFNLPWYLIGRRGAELCPDYSEINKISYNVESNGNTYVNHINYDIEKPKVSQEFVENEKNAKK